MHLFPRRTRFLSLAFAALGFWFVIASCARGAAPGTSATTAASSRPTTTRARSRPATRATSRPATTTAPKLAAPASIADLLKAAQAAYDAANGPDWAPASTKQLTVLQDAVKNVKAKLNAPTADQRRRLTQIDNDLKTLTADISANKHQAALDETNRIWRVCGVLADTFINSTPQHLWQMQYLAREIQVWSSDPADPTKLKALPARFDTEWTAISKDMTAKAGDALAKEYTDLAAKLKSAATTDDFAKLAKPLLEILNKFEKSYQ